MAESKVGVRSTQCLDRRVPGKQPLIIEIAAREDDRNVNHAKAAWQCTTADAHIKRKHLYPSSGLNRATFMVADKGHWHRNWAADSDRRQRLSGSRRMNLLRLGLPLSRWRAMHQTIAGESHAIHVPLDENLLVGIALTRKSVEARSMLVWGEHCKGCVMPSCYACCAFYAPRQDLKRQRFDQGIVPAVAERCRVCAHLSARGKA
jgi:hypothetical protein